MIGNKEVINVSIEDIIPNRFQPRLTFGDKELNDLANSIKQHGIIQPLLLRKIGDKYEIIAGERRYKAASIAGLYNVPAIIVETDDNTSAEIAITENIQRKDLNAIEEAQSYKKLINKGQTQEEIAKKLGIGQSTVANKVRLLALSDEAQDALLNNKISERHARGLLRITDASIQVNLLNKIISEKLTVKQSDDEINKILGTKTDDDSDSEVLTPPFNIEVPNFSSVENPFLQREEIRSEDNFMPELFQPNEKESKNEDIVNIDDSQVLSPFEPAPINLNEVEIKTDEEDFFLENPIKNMEVNLNTENELINEFKNQKEGIEVFNTTSQPSSGKYLNVVNKMRKFIRDAEYETDNISSEEFDFEDMYQIVIKIKKDE